VTPRIVRRTAGTAVAAGCAAAAALVPALLVPALPALAHGAPVRPVSRTAECADPGSAARDTAACRAARAANGGPFGAFDNVRVAGVDGRDRDVVPDGHLCSGGLGAYRGLDLARADWPATTLAAGGPLDLRYRATIPHEGSFRVYLTRAGYDPRRPLRWADLGATPILTAANPPLRAGAYRMSGTLPAGRTGRHVLFVVWQTTSTPDTYYSCSDVVLTAAGAAPVAKPRRSARPAHATPPAPAASPSTAGYQSWPGTGVPAASERPAPGRPLVTAAVVALVAVAAAAALLRLRVARRRRPRRR
jgi:predicted carbohydrate-binding protein with CBM5 and CBM33 domain